ncbi:MAG TPA: isoprenylcysteine carboxylmethyltransferase family protein [Ignavibacteriaceae bacterium]|nr:isoprenylcysteine carboxylmethyltransferase family protein [Ignavibacteriaceae bacterium]
MNVLGVGPKIGIPAFSYLITVIIIHYLTKPFFLITENNYSSLLIAGIILILLGIISLAYLGRKVIKSFNEEKLMTDGIYIVLRNPMYASYIIFIVPGLCLLFNSWIILTTVVIFYIVFHHYIKEEYKFLEEKYGEQYRMYLNKVKIKFL